MPENFKNFIAGEWVAPRTGAYFENRNPADWDDVIGCFPRSGAEDVARAIVSAKRGFAQWSKTPAPIRGECCTGSAICSSSVRKRSHAP